MSHPLVPKVAEIAGSRANTFVVVRHSRLAANGALSLSRKAGSRVPIAAGVLTPDGQALAKILIVHDLSHVAVDVVNDFYLLDPKEVEVIWQSEDIAKGPTPTASVDEGESSGAIIDLAIIGELRPTGPLLHENFDNALLIYLIAIHDLNALANVTHAPFSCTTETYAFLWKRRWRVEDKGAALFTDPTTRAAVLGFFSQVVASAWSDDDRARWVHLDTLLVYVAYRVGAARPLLGSKEAGEDVIERLTHDAMWPEFAEQKADPSRLQCARHRIHIMSRLAKLPMKYDRDLVRVFLSGRPGVDDLIKALTSCRQHGLPNAQAGLALKRSLKMSKDNEAEWRQVLTRLASTKTEPPTPLRTSTAVMVRGESRKTRRLALAPTDAPDIEDLEAHLPP